MDNHILKQDVLSGYPSKDYDDKTTSIIENIEEVIFLDEENGWINNDGDKVEIGTWDRDSRIATLDNKIEQRGKLLVIEVNNATIDGTGAVIGDESVAINIVGQHDINLKNFIIENCELAMYIEFSRGVSIEYISFKENEQAISINRSSEIKIKNNLIESSKNSCVGIFILDSGKVIIQDNSIYIKMRNTSNDSMQNSYSGVATENSTTIYIINNEIEVIDGSSQIDSLESYCINGYCINSYSTNDTLIKYNNLYIKNNNLNLSNCNSVEVNLSSIYLDSNNTRIDVEENNVLVEGNNIDVSYNEGEIGFYGILCSNENNGNSIKNNYISINSNIYNLNSTTKNDKYIYFTGILLDSYNNYNEINGNQIELQENIASFKSDLDNVINLVCGVYFNLDNTTNNIINNDFIIKENNIDKSDSITTNFSLVHLYYNNICNTIKGNNLNGSQGNGIVLVSKNDVTEILENNIMENSTNGILLSKLKNIEMTNTVTIMDNSIINNGEYGLYITRGNYLNIIRENNFISKINKNIYDDNSSEFMNYYEKNYYNDQNG
ncbi:MAG: NosD domain-containing protein [Clostridium celatum]|nr:NosD domain-containing protein [Clostridium celatum]